MAVSLVRTIACWLRPAPFWRTGPLLLLAVLLSSCQLNAQGQRDTLLLQNWEGTGYIRSSDNTVQPLQAGPDQQYGFRQYNNRADSWQNVWATPQYTGINGGQDSLFRKPDTFYAAPLDSLAGPFPANHTPNGLRGAHVITSQNPAANRAIAGYYRRPQQPLGQTAATAAGFYTPALSTKGWDSIRVTFWYKVRGELNEDYGSLRYHTGTDAPQAPIPPGKAQNAPLGYWNIAQPDTSLVSGAEPAQGLSHQLYSDTAIWRQARYTLPASAAHQPALRLAWFWHNNNDGQGAFPALIIDDIVISGRDRGAFLTKRPAEERLCPHARFPLHFQADSNVLAPGQQLWALLSDSTGSFAKADTIGSATYDPPAQQVPVALPGDLPVNQGGYRFRIVAAGGRQAQPTSPPASLKEAVQAQLLSLDPLQKCPGTSVRLSVTGTDSVFWYRDDTLLAASRADTLRWQHPGNYRALIQQAGCVLPAQDTLTINNFEAPQALVDTAAIPELVCWRDSTALPAGNGLPAGGQGRYQGAGLAAPRVFDGVIAGTGLHQMYYEYSSPNGCRDSLPFRIRVPEPIFPRLEAANPDAATGGCGRRPLQLVVKPAGQSQVWSNGDSGPSTSFQAAQQAFATVTDSLGCSHPSDTLALTYRPVPAPPEIERVEGNRIEGLAEVADGSIVQVYRADTAQPVGTATVQDGAWQFFFNSPPAAGTQLWARVWSDNNCDGSVDSLDRRSALSEPFLKAFDPPNAFSPNGDGLNDKLVFGGQGFTQAFPNARLRIFNRWGQLVYQSDHYQNNWTGDNLPESTYFYTLKLKSGQKALHGFIELQR